MDDDKGKPDRTILPKRYRTEENWTVVIKEQLSRFLDILKTFWKEILDKFSFYLDFFQWLRKKIECILKNKTKKLNDKKEIKLYIFSIILGILVTWPLNSKFWSPDHWMPNFGYLTTEFQILVTWPLNSKFPFKVHSFPLFCFSLPFPRKSWSRKDTFFSDSENLEISKYYASTLTQWNIDLARRLYLNYPNLSHKGNERYNPRGI